MQTQQRSHTPRSAFEAFERALRLEAHHLSGRPDLLWQQLHNRLQWEHGGVLVRLEAERRLRTQPGAGRWVRLQTPFPEGEALLLTLGGHRAAVQACAFTPDAERIMSGGDDGVVKVWDAQSGAELRTIASDTRDVSACAFGPDAHRVVFGGAMHLELHVCDMESGAVLRTLAGHTGDWYIPRVWACAFSPDGRRIASVSDLGTRLWDADTGAELLELRSPSGGVVTCAFAPGADRIVTGAVDHALKVWDARSGIELRTLEGHTGTVRACAFSPDGRWIVSGDDDGALKVWDAQSGAELRSLQAHVGGVGACAFSPDGRRIVSGGSDQALKVWDAESGAALETLVGHAAGVRACAFSPDGRRIVSGGDDHSVKVWDAESAASAQSRVVAHPGGARACAYGREGRTIVSGGADDAVRVWDTDSGAELRTLSGQTGGVWSCASSPDGRCILAGAGDRTLRMWDAESGRKLHTLVGHGGPVGACAFSADGRLVVSAGGNKTIQVRPMLSDSNQDDATIRVWDAESGAALRILEGHGGGVWTCAVSPDGRLIVSGGEDLTVRVWDAGSGAPLRALEGHTGRRAIPTELWLRREDAYMPPVPEGVRACAFSPDGRRILSAGGDGILRLWDVGTGDELGLLTGHTGWVHACAFSPDGRLIVSGGEDHTVRVWDGETGTELARLPLPGGVLSVATHPTRPRAVCGDAGGGLYRIELIGFSYGPVVVSATDVGKGPAIRCPACWREYPLDERWPGEVISCPTPGCEQPLRVNPLQLSRPEPEPPASPEAAPEQPASREADPERTARRRPFWKRWSRDA